MYVPVAGHIAPTTALNYAEPFPIGIQRLLKAYLLPLPSAVPLQSRQICRDKTGHIAREYRPCHRSRTIIAPEGKIEAIINVEIFVCLCLSCNYIRLRQVRSGRRGPFLFCL